MSSLNRKEKKLSEKQLEVAKADLDRDVIKNVYDVESEEAVDEILSDLEDNTYVKDYLYTKAQVEAVETELYMNATMDDPEGKSAVKQKAIDSFLDRVKGKAMQKTDITTDGKAMPITINIIKPE